MNEKQKAIYLLDGIILLVAAVCMVLTYKYAANPSLRFFLMVAYLAVAAALITIEIRSLGPARPKAQAKKPEAAALVLLGENQRAIKTWDLFGHTTLLIGKNTGETEVDIDLADTEYGAMIDEQQAVLNYTQTGWYIENISHRSDVGVRQPGTERAQLLTVGVPCKIQPGDEVHIAGNTKISVV